MVKLISLYVISRKVTEPINDIEDLLYVTNTLTCFPETKQVPCHSFHFYSYFIDGYLGKGKHFYPSPILHRFPKAHFKLMKTHKHSKGKLNISILNANVMLNDTCH